MASLSSLLLASAFLLAGSAFFYRYDAGSGNKTSATTTTHLHFYMHDDYTGPRPTAMRVVSGRAASTGDDGTALKTAPRQFGDIVVLNNALTAGPGGGSARVGTAQGWAVRVSDGGIVSDLTLHLVLEAGEHRGSSLTARGRIDMDATVRESVLIGGTGRFRYARGYMTGGAAMEHRRPQLKATMQLPRRLQRRRREVALLCCCKSPAAKLQ